MSDTENKAGGAPRFEQFLGCIAITVTACWLPFVLILPGLMFWMGIHFWMPASRWGLASFPPGMLVLMAAGGTGVLVVWFYGFARKPVTLFSALWSIALLVALTALSFVVYSDADVRRHWLRYFGSYCAYGMVQVALSWGLAFVVRHLLDKWLGPNPGEEADQDA
ncbi:MAG: hypothetical protein ACYSU0_00410 [Planctomycetota bacterium]|jgi:hypothetical protein